MGITDDGTSSHERGGFSWVRLDAHRRIDRSVAKSIKLDGGRSEMLINSKAPTNRVVKLR